MSSYFIDFIKFVEGSLQKNIFALLNPSLISIIIADCNLQYKYIPFVKHHREKKMVLNFSINMVYSVIGTSCT